MHKISRFLKSIALLVLSVIPAFATLHYVDSSVVTSRDGLSWATAWKGVSNITGLAAGDTVYFSGGSVSQAYTINNWTPVGGTSGNPITYSTGQDAGHNGIVTVTSTTFLSGTFSNVVITGNVGGLKNWSVTLTGDYFWEGGSGTNANVKLYYITANFGSSGAGFHWSSANATGMEIANCSFVKDNDSSNIHDFIFFGVNGPSAGSIDVHDNFIQYPYGTADHSIGDDMWIYPGGVNFHNNTVQGHARSTYSWTQHSDGFQTNLGSNIHVYNNVFLDPGESMYYDDSQSPGTVSSTLIYNNLILRTFSCNGGAQRIIDMNPESAGLNTTAYVDMVIANNTIVDDNGAACDFGIRVSGAGSYTRVYVRNNLGFPGGGADVTADAGVTVSNNYVGSATQFASYTQYAGAANNLRLLSTDTTAKGQGFNVSAYFTTDFSGSARLVPWDIGAYAYQQYRPVASIFGSVSFQGQAKH